MNLIKNYWKIGIAVFSFLMINIATFGQGTGLLMDDDAYNKDSQLPNFGGKSIDLPLVHSLKDYCPEVQHQGNIGSCTGWAAGYGAFTIMAAIADNNKDTKSITENAFSALYLYNQAKLGDCSQGAYFSKVLKVLKEQGDCYSKDFDHPIDNCDRLPGEEEESVANNIKHEVKDYYTLFKSTEKAEQKILQTKISIYEGKPVIIGMLIRENFKRLNTADKYWNPESGNTGSAGGHAMVAIGYHDGKEAFLVMNSWGKSWGQDGFMWVKYDDFVKYCVYGYQLLVGKKKQRRSADVANPTNTTTTTTDHTTNNENETEEESTNNMNAVFVFQEPDGWSDEEEQFLFKEVASNFNGAYYKLNDKWKVGQQFQLVSKEITKDRYIYVFSINSENESHVHWPRNQKYNQKFEELNESAIVPYDNVEIIMPGKDKVLVLDKEGTDHLFVLYSDEAITDLVEKIEEIKNNEGEYINRLQNAFGDRLIPSEAIQYNNDKMSFSTNAKTGNIVPIILQVESK